MPSIYLQGRDLFLLRLIYDHGFILAEHAAKLFPSYGDALRRVGKLKAAGLLFSEASIVMRRVKILRLTAKGRAAAEAYLPYRLGKLRPLHQTKLLHDSFVITVRLRLSALWHGEWTPEALLPRSQDIPDGVFTFPSGKNVFIEVENSHKAQQRFLSRLYGFSGQVLVLYVATWPEVERSIRKTLSMAAGSPPAALVSLSSLQSQNPDIWSPGQKLSLFHVKEF